uniref:Myb-like protein P isoform X1 n=1 Tax=Dermatophagoides pteronyssinus TaxID=6956 RepID=A0A6P6XSP4_DERPT|nr:myb-like protein P isoform X1 [Dermatophagoides pteronyssinus]
MKMMKMSTLLSSMDNDNNGYDNDMQLIDYQVSSASTPASQASSELTSKSPASSVSPASPTSTSSSSDCDKCHQHFCDSCVYCFHRKNQCDNKKPTLVLPVLKSLNKNPNRTARLLPNHYNYNHRQTRVIKTRNNNNRLQLIQICLILLLITSITSVTCMLDALKALFILTGASTYLVTKYVNISQQQQPNQQHHPHHPNHQQQTNGPFWTPPSTLSLSPSQSMINANHSWMASSSSMSQRQWPMFRENHQQQQQQSSSFSNIPLLLMPEGINFLKGDQSSTVNSSSSNGGNNKSPPPSSIRPIYVLAIEEEENEQNMPKSLLNLSISSDHNHYHDNGNNQSINNLLNNIKVDYIIDTKLDDYAQVFKYFALNRTTGELFLIRPLDRDPPNGRSRWRFSIQARNRQTQMILAMADIAITVRDINDNKPLFEQKLYRTTLMENGPAGQILTKLHAVDFDEADLVDNGKILYSLIKSPALIANDNNKNNQSKWTTDLFQIDPHNGVLTVLDCCFDREKQSEYNLIARATDAGGLWDETKILVNIGDINDNPPRFLNPSRTLRLNEMNVVVHHNQQQQQQQQQQYEQQQQEDENIFTFFILDNDLPKNNHHHYEIINSTDCPLFKRFYIVVNIDGSGTLYGTRRNESELRDYILTGGSMNKSIDRVNNQMSMTNNNQSSLITATSNILSTTTKSETICYLDVVVRDSVRDSIKSSSDESLVYEDQTTLTLVYSFDWNIVGNSGNGGKNKLFHNNNNNNGTEANFGTGNLNSSNANAVIALDHFAAAAAVGGPKASDLSTINQRKLSNGCSSINDGGDGALCSNSDDHHQTINNNNRPHSSFSLKNNSKSINSNDNDILSSFSSFKQWLKSTTNSKTFLIYASIIIFTNIIILLVVTTFWLIRQNARRINETPITTTTNLVEETLRNDFNGQTTNVGTYYQIPMMEQQQQNLFDSTNILFINDNNAAAAASYLDILKPPPPPPSSSSPSTFVTNDSQISSSYLNC